MKVGLLGGTFDPVHNAHLAMARAALETLRLDRVLWLPTGNPAYRKAPVASGADRVAMLKLALAHEPRYEVDERELQAGASGYTVDTLKALRRELRDDDLYLLIGADQFAKFDSWRDPGEVKRLAELAVFLRPRIDIDPRGARVVPMQALEISASDIRARAARGEDLAGLVPAAVANYIQGRRLYS
ncbi:MAG TPA: nicotinate-nucleotide adenylyltransferase [Burkholderiales bacterium]